MSTGTNNKENTPRLRSEHVEILRVRAIPEQFAWDHGIRSVDLGERKALEARNNLPRMWKRLPLHPVSGILIPYPNNEDYIRVRSDVRSYPKAGEPGTHMLDEEVEVPRYIAPAMPVIPYIPDEVIKVSGDVTIPLYITEAPLKALSLTANGFLAIGLGGVTAGAHDKCKLDELGEVVVHKELRRIQWRGRRVYIVFDAGLGGDDDPGNPLVAMGAARVWKVLSDLGAEVMLVRIPYFHAQDSDPQNGIIWRPEDQGPDDFLFRCGVPAFQTLVDAAVHADPQKRFEGVIASNPEEQAPAVGRVLRELFVRATLQAADEATLTSVAGVLKGIVPKRGLKEAIKAFTESIRARFTRDAPDWVGALACNASGVPRPTRENVELALRSDPGLMGLLAWNEFTQTIVFQREPPWAERYRASKGTKAGSPWTDEDDTRLGSYLAEKYQITDVQPSKLRAAVVVTAKERVIHPVRDYLNGLTWDGVQRLEAWLSTYLGVSHSTYTSLVGRWWLISAVARIMSPGCQVDHCLVLEGPQGASKTSALRALAGEWFSDADLGDLKSKEAALALQGVWLEEFGEGAIYSRASAKDVKAFVTRRWDDLVLKFSNLRTRLLRQVFFAVTINEGSDYLVDSTGNRRFWPVMCGAIDVEALKLGVEQLWAEAVHEYRAGAKWWPSTDEERKLCSVEQEARQSHDPWEPRIEEGLRHLETVTVSGCLGILGLPIEKQGRHETLRATAVLRTLGWTEGPRTKHARSWVRGPHADPYVTPPLPISAEELAQYGHLKVIPGGLDQDLSFDDSLNLDLL